MSFAPRARPAWSRSSSATTPTPTNTRKPCRDDRGPPEPSAWPLGLARVLDLGLCCKLDPGGWVLSDRRPHGCVEGGLRTVDVAGGVPVDVHLASADRAEHRRRI